MCFLDKWTWHMTLCYFYCLFIFSSKLFLYLYQNFAISYSNASAFKSSSILSFHTSTDPSCIYDNIYWICSSTASFLIFILIYNLHAVIKPETFSKLLLNTYSFATSVFDPVLGLDALLALTSSPTSVTSSIWICAYIAISCSCCCWIICSRFTLCQLILCGDVGEIDNNSSSSVDGGDKERAELVLVSLSNSVRHGSYQR